MKITTLALVIVILLSAIAMTGCKSKSERAEKIYQEAFAYSCANNPDVAFPLYVKAANMGHAIAEYAVGASYLNGLGVKADPAEGVRLLTAVAVKGNKCSSAAQLDLARCYVNGTGVAQNSAEAIIWAKQSAQLGDGDACALLAGIYGGYAMECQEQGDYIGYTQYFEDSYFWLWIAKARGADTSGIEYFYNKYLQEDRQIVISERARQWLATHEK